jgi:hypothetical protein
VTAAEVEWFQKRITVEASGEVGTRLSKEKRRRSRGAIGVRWY